MDIKCFVVLKCLLSEELRRDNKNFYFEECSLSSVYGYALTKKGLAILKDLEKRSFKK